NSLTLFSFPLQPFTLFFFFLKFPAATVLSIFVRFGELNPSYKVINLLSFPLLLCTLFFFFLKFPAAAVLSSFFGFSDLKPSYKVINFRVNQ
ncbi:MAG: hypothetical protein O4804_14470, partial [Trichodesmium sp. St11_bin5]|nr:hypothetical protein [Trichodesmium sp. St11_bin5]